MWKKKAETVSFEVVYKIPLANKMQKNITKTRI